MSLVINANLFDFVYYSLVKPYHIYMEMSIRSTHIILFLMECCILRQHPDMFIGYYFHPIMVRYRQENQKVMYFTKEFILSHASNYRNEKMRFDRLLSTTHFHDMLVYV
jgi:hypothetical protein